MANVVQKCAQCPTKGVPARGSLHHLHDGTYVCSKHAKCALESTGAKCAGTSEYSAPDLFNVGGVMVHAVGACNRCAGCNEFTNYDHMRKSVADKLYCRTCIVCPQCCAVIAPGDGVPVDVDGVEEQWHRACVMCDMCGHHPETQGVCRKTTDGDIVDMRCPDCITCDVCPMLITGAGVVKYTLHGAPDHIWAHNKCYLKLLKRKRSA